MAKRGLRRLVLVSAAASAAVGACAALTGLAAIAIEAGNTAVGDVPFPEPPESASANPGATWDDAVKVNS